MCSQAELIASQQQGPALCIKQCGFFASASTGNMCSKCYKDEQAAKKTETSEWRRGGSVAIGRLLNAPASPAEEAVAATPPVSPAVGPVPSAVEPPAAPESTEPKSKKRNRCFACSRKVGILGFECRCEGVFCGEHRYPHTHQCSVDVKEQNRAKVDKANPTVATAKVEKL